MRFVRGERPPLSRSWACDLALIAAAAALGLRAYDAFTTEASYAPYYAPPLVLLLALLHQRIGRPLAGRAPGARSARWARWRSASRPTRCSRSTPTRTPPSTPRAARS